MDLSIQRRAGDWFLQRNAISQAQAQSIPDANPHELSGELTGPVLTLTESQYGFLGEVVPNGAGSLQMHAAFNVVWDELHLDTLFNAAIKSGQLVIFAQIGSPLPPAAGWMHGRVIS